MNIFVLDTDPKLCAQYHHDIHLNKMILETAQLLSTAHHVLESEYKDKLYKKTHTNHPCAKFVRSNFKSYKWTWYLLCNLCLEYEIRFNKRHKTDDTLCDILSHEPKSLNRSDNELLYPLCMPDIYKSNSVVESYRNFYINEKAFNKNGKFMAFYTNRKKPQWFKEAKEKYV